jgi:hypothetical protein
MIDYKVIMLLSLMIAAFLSLAYIDSKYKLNFIAWMNGEKSSPFSDAKKISSYAWSSSFIDQTDESECALSHENKALKSEVEILRERVQVLEKIVTEPSYELNQKLNQL